MISFKSSTKYASTPYMTLKSSSGLTEWYASVNACTAPWSVIAIALWPHDFALFMMSFTSETPSISLILVWQCSSTLFSMLLSNLGVVKSGIFFIPAKKDSPISWSNLSIVVTPLILMKFPFFRCSINSSRCSFFTKILAAIVSVKSVMTILTIVFSPFRSSRISVSMICPRITTSPTSPCIVSIVTASSSKSRP